MKKCTAEIYCEKVKNDYTCCADCEFNKSCDESCSNLMYADSCELCGLREEVPHELHD